MISHCIKESVTFICSLPLLLNSCTNQQIDDSIISTNDEGVYNRSALVSNPPKYYWHNGRKVFLYPNNEKEFILYDASDEAYILGELPKSTARSKTNGAISGIISNFKTLYAPSKRESIPSSLKWRVVPKNLAMRLHDKILYRGEFFKDEKGQSVALSHLFYVKLKSEDDYPTLKSYAEKYGVFTISKSKYLNNWYKLGVLNSSYSTLDLSNIFQESGVFKVAQPDIMVDRDLTVYEPNDPLISFQWGLNNIGQEGGIPGIDISLFNANEITQGDPQIIVAVIDHGIQLNHPDLNIHSLSYDTENRVSPSVIRGNHGTACAGIIASKSNNHLGVAGIAPLCPLMSISNNLRFFIDIG